MSELRRLATILALDVAGYSRASETDDSASAASVARLRTAVEQIAGPLGGRIFNSAGDSLMLEFSAASAGVQAAMEILARTKSGEEPLPRVRVGLHLGEVIVTDSGDLLGHGVNVAARLQQMAAPGTAVVSHAVRTQIRQAALITFVPQGRFQLDKMSEELEVFTLASPGEAPAIQPTAKRAANNNNGLLLGIAIGVALLGAALFFVTPMLRGEAPTLTALTGAASGGATQAIRGATVRINDTCNGFLVNQGGQVATVSSCGDANATSMSYFNGETFYPLSGDSSGPQTSGDVSVYSFVTTPPGASPGELAQATPAQGARITVAEIPADDGRIDSTTCQIGEDNGARRALACERPLRISGAPAYDNAGRLVGLADPNGLLSVEAVRGAIWRLRAH